jgi:hypothetical protein
VSETYAPPALAGYREVVAERLGSGDAFGEVERAIDGIAELSEDQKAALWLFAFAKHDSGGTRRAATAPLTPAS